jgi:hypothetical protein
MISKELLEAVLGITFLTHKEVKGSIRTYYSQDQHNDWNTHELAHKCNTWAILQGYNIDPRTWLSDKECYPDYPNNTPLFDVRVEGIEKGYENRGVVCLYEFNHKQEFKHLPEAIFKACQWVLENKE